MISATMPVLTCWKPVPAHMFTACGSPARTDAARSGLVIQWISGYPNVASASCSSTNRLRSPRAYRPEKCPRHNGFGELRILKRGSVHRATARFVRQQERRSELGGGRSRRQDAADVVRGHQPAGRHDRHIDGSLDLSQQLVEGLGGWLRGRVEGAAMPARRRPLYRHSVHTAGNRRLRLGQRCHGADNRDARLTQSPALLSARHPEGERCDAPAAGRAAPRSWPPNGRRRTAAHRAGRRSVSPPARVLWRSARCRPGCPHSAAAQTDSRRSGRR